ncbi:MAG TPA: hypothetical protein VGF75_01975 [Candidatus Saccharimonadales bacterium]
MLPQSAAKIFMELSAERRSNEQIYSVSILTEQNAQRGNAAMNHVIHVKPGVNFRNSDWSSLFNFILGLEDYRLTLYADGISIS